VPVLARLSLMWIMYLESADRDTLLLHTTLIYYLVHITVISGHNRLSPIVHTLCNQNQWDTLLSLDSVPVSKSLTKACHIQPHTDYWAKAKDAELSMYIDKVDCRGQDHQFQSKSPHVSLDFPLPQFCCPASGCFDYACIHPWQSWICWLLSGPWLVEVVNVPQILELSIGVVH